MNVKDKKMSKSQYFSDSKSMKPSLNTMTGKIRIAPHDGKGESSPE
jgi:hypothetical protein